jgi:ADP-heptose:LPS heptosyltransferase
MSKAGISVDAMRRIDYLAGVPLCILGSFLLKLTAFLRRSPRPVRRILFIELSEMGSTILATPAMRQARERSGASLYFVIFAQNAGSLGITDTIPAENVFTIAPTSLWRLIVDTLRFLAWTRRNQIDSVIDLELFSRYTALLAGFCGADRRVGFYRFNDEGLNRGEMLTHRVPYNPHVHIAKNFIALVDALLSERPSVPYSKILIGDEALSISVPAPAQASCDRVRGTIDALAPGGQSALYRLVLINPNASDLLPQRRWMRERFAALIRRLLAAHEDVLVLITGAPSEQAGAEELAAQCDNRRCIAFAGRTSLPELMALYALATAMVSNDSGPAHFAAAAGLPTIVLFGPETPKLYQPLGRSIVIYAGLACSPCVSASNHRNSACTDNVCMRAIEVDEVYRALDGVLAERPAVSVSPAG